MKKNVNWKKVGKIALITVASLAATFITVAAVITVKRASDREFGDKLRSIEGVSSVERIWQFRPTFQEKYLVTFTQPLDWEDQSKGTFEQRVEIGYQGEDNVNVYYVSGYCLNDTITGSKAIFRSDDRKELARMYNGNSIQMEYRFFGESKPEGFTNDGTEYWEYLTVENAARDFYSVMEKLSTVLDGSTVFTGASKGGYTTNTMAYYYPDYCDAYVSYVAPLCDGTEDPRLMRNLYESIGDEGYPAAEAADMRQTMLDYEVYCIKNREVLQEKYYQNAMKEGCHYRDTITKELLWDMAVMEFSGQYWQYGGGFEKLEEVLAMPETTEKEQEKKQEKAYELLLGEIGPENWDTEYFTMPYYWQALQEMGSYKCDFSGLREAVIEETGKDMLVVTEDMEEGILARTMFTPEQQKLLHYDGSLRKELNEWAETTDANVIMIYGGCDIWYAVRMDETDNESIHIFTDDDGSHYSSIRSLEKEDRDECKALLNEWLKD